jgi:hypothetical protein
MTAAGGAGFMRGGDWRLHVESSKTITGARPNEGLGGKFESP